MKSPLFGPSLGGTRTANVTELIAGVFVHDGPSPPTSGARPCGAVCWVASTSHGECRLRTEPLGFGFQEVEAGRLDEGYWHLADLWDALQGTQLLGKPSTLALKQSAENIKVWDLKLGFLFLPFRRACCEKDACAAQLNRKDNEYPTIYSSRTTLKAQNTKMLFVAFPLSPDLHLSHMKQQAPWTLLEPCLSETPASTRIRSRIQPSRASCVLFFAVLWLPGFVA